MNVVHVINLVTNVLEEQILNAVRVNLAFFTTTKNVH